MKSPYDQNGNRLYRDVRRNKDGTWSANVWFGGWRNGLATDLRRYTYRTRREARNADISDEDGAISYHGGEPEEEEF